MKLLGRARPTASPPSPSFGAWVLRQFLHGRDISTLSFAELERVCAAAGSILCAEHYASPGSELPRPAGPSTIAEADLVARRTADGFRAALGDRRHAVLTWPWEHLGTRLAWLAQRQGALDVDRLASDLESIAAAYASRHREQLAHVLVLWRQVVAGLAGQYQAPSLEVMARKMREVFASVPGAWHPA